MKNCKLNEKIYKFEELLHVLKDYIFQRLFGEDFKIIFGLSWIFLIIHIFLLDIVIYLKE